MRRPVAVWLLAFAIVLKATAADEVTAIFVLTGDQHSAYERTAQFVAHVERLKKENPGVPLAVLIDGDTFEQGNVVAKRSGGAVEFAMFAALARRAPTILNLGNHEPEFYDPAQTVARVQATGVRVVSNLADKSSGQLLAPASLHLSLGNTEAVIVGVTTDQLTQYRAAVRPLLDLTDPVVWAKKYFADALRGAAIPIVMSHAGLRNDRAMFPLVPDGTLFVGAHDHLQLVHEIGRTVYVHSGSWNSHFSVARLHRGEGGSHWTVAQIPIAPTDPADPELAALVRATGEKFLGSDDLAVVGWLPRALSRSDAARWVTHVVAEAAAVDAAFIGNTTFGAGLPGGAVTRVAFDACVRFDGTICVASVSGAQLRTWLARANEGIGTPFADRQGEFLFADGPKEIVVEKTYRIATTDWGMKNRERYFGTTGLVFAERPELRLKAVVAKALSESGSSEP